MTQPCARVLVVPPGVLTCPAMDDQDIVKEIDRLAREEHTLERDHLGQPLAEDRAARLRAVEVALDQCWDLLRQRRARRNAGQDPDEATVRAQPTVEGYQQ
jgi:Protein of unknown function (DUF2630)